MPNKYAQFGRSPNNAEFERMPKKHAQFGGMTNNVTNSRKYDQFGRMSSKLAQYSGKMPNKCLRHKYGFVLAEYSAFFFKSYNNILK